MVNIILAYRAGIGWVLSLIAATVTVMIFQVTFGFGPLVAVPVGVLAFVSTSVMWASFVNSLTPPGPPSNSGR